jgi:hypothetical protein
MDAKISPAFWDDLEDQPSEVKLTCLWAMTNSSRDNCGVFRFAPARFAFQTGLPATWLLKTIEALPRMFFVDGEKVLLRNFIRYQIGVGQALARDNQAKGLHKGFKLVSARLQSAILETYPELKPLLSPYQALSSTGKPLETLGFPSSSPSDTPPENPSLPEGLPKPQIGRIGEDSTDRLGKAAVKNPPDPGVGDPTIEEVIAAAAFIGMAEPEARKFFAHFDSKGWMVGGDKLVRWRSRLPSWLANARAMDTGKKTGPPALNSELAAIEAALEHTTDPAERERLKKRRRELGGDK